VLSSTFPAHNIDMLVYIYIIMADKGRAQLLPTIMDTWMGWDSRNKKKVLPTSEEKRRVTFSTLYYL
jgi:hypothetical protein